ncbi:MAG TPA: VCBS repeat-containing protein, partial [Woeseiaceae bacterium]|nr:VCBS repeat-containing protein [Woeseiaceae bacterium]
MTNSKPSRRGAVPAAVNTSKQSPIKAAQLFALCALFAAALDARAQATFQDVSEAAGMTGFTESWGAAIGDFNSDNCLDIFVNGHRDYPRAYRNTCTGTFEDVTYEMDDGTWIELPQDDKHGAVFGDYDNDGDDDLFIGVSVTGDGQLWVNQGDGTFLERASELNLRSDFAARIASFVDFNHDGKLDSIQMGLAPGSYFRYQNSFGTFSTQFGTGQACNQEDINFAHFIDINDDGTLELVCAARGEWPYLAYDITNIPFVDVTASLPSLGNVNSVIVGDFDRNLRTDVLMIRGSTRPSGAAFANSQRVEAWFARNPGDPSNYGFNFQTGGSITMTVWNRDLSRNEAPFVTNLNQGQSGCNSQFADYQVCATWNGGQNRWDVHMPDEGQAYIIIESTQNISNLNEVGLSNRDLPIPARMYFNTAGGF